MMFWQFVSVASCVQRFMLAVKCRLRISFNIWAKLAYLLQQQRVKYFVFHFNTCASFREVTPQLGASTGGGG